jgi:hypothetical protein
MRDIEPMRYLIPLYVNGTLSDSQREEFERLLVDNPELKEEVEKWKKIGDAYRRVELELPVPSTRVYSKIVEKIKTTERKSFLERIMPSPSLSFAFIAAQFLIIIALLFYVAGDKAEFKTLSAPVNEGYDRINVVFREDASAAAIRQLLLKVNGKIVDGPFSSGLYVIEFSSRDQLGNALTAMKGSGLVVMAEKAY